MKNQENNLKKEKYFARVNEVSYIEDIEQSTGVSKEFSELAFKIVAGYDPQKERQHNSRQISRLS